MTAHDHSKQSTSDPLGLSDLEAIEPGYDGWARIESALQANQASKRNWQRTGSWLAVAASLVLVISLLINNTGINTPGNPPAQEFATSAAEPASVPVEDNNLHVRTSDCRGHSESYRLTFFAKPEWQRMRIPWDALTANKVDAPLDSSTLQRIGILGWMREFEADIALAEISLYS